MAQKKYGVDTTKKVTPIKVRDAIIECFTKAHEKELNEMKKFSEFKSKEEFEKLKMLNVELMVKNIFTKIEADYDNPTKENLVQVCDELAKFAKHFRDPGIIIKHYNEIQELIDKIK